MYDTQVISTNAHHQSNGRDVPEREINFTFPNSGKSVYVRRVSTAMGKALAMRVDREAKEQGIEPTAPIVEVPVGDGDVLKEKDLGDPTYQHRLKAATAWKEQRLQQLSEGIIFDVCIECGPIDVQAVQALRQAMKDAGSPFDDAQSDKLIYIQNFMCDGHEDAVAVANFAAGRKITQEAIQERARTFPSDVPGS